MLTRARQPQFRQLKGERRCSRSVAVKRTNCRRLISRDIHTTPAVRCVPLDFAVSLADCSTKRDGRFRSEIWPSMTERARARGTGQVPVVSIATPAAAAAAGYCRGVRTMDRLACVL